MQANTEYKRPSDSQLKETLDPHSYHVLVDGATEPQYSSKYVEVEGDGIYVDIATGEPLFTTFDQYNAGCGWPSFTAPVTGTCVLTRKDPSHGMIRTEVRSAAGGFHLGHVFDDGPPERGGLRYCINGAAMRFIPMENMEVEGYSYLFPYMEKKRRGRDKP
jgi:peptide methionine sulfoxide reductase msrA/msrB